MMEFTFIIKTFERPKALQRLLKTMVEYGYIDNPIIIIDDSKKFIKIDSLPFKDFKYIFTEFDIGLSAGRNLALSMVMTRSFITLDDDFFFTYKTNIDLLVKTMQKYDLDICGGSVNALKFTGRIDYVIDSNGNKVIRLWRKKYEEKLDENIFLFNQIPNFFIGNTKKVLSFNGWDKEIKIGHEHITFFEYCKRHELKVGFTREVKINNSHARGTKLFKRSRRRVEMYNQAAIKSMGADTLVKCDTKCKHPKICITASGIKVDISKMIVQKEPFKEKIDGGR